MQACSHLIIVTRQTDTNNPTNSHEHIDMQTHIRKHGIAQFDSKIRKAMG